MQCWRGFRGERGSAQEQLAEWSVWAAVLPSGRQVTRISGARVAESALGRQVGVDIFCTFIVQLYVCALEEMVCYRFSRRDGLLLQETEAHTIACKPAGHECCRAAGRSFIPVG